MHCVTSPLNDVCNICSKLGTALNSCTAMDFDWSYHFLTCEKALLLAKYLIEMLSQHLFHDFVR